MRRNNQYLKHATLLVAHPVMYNQYTKHTYCTKCSIILNIQIHANQSGQMTLNQQEGILNTCTCKKSKISVQKLKIKLMS